MDRAASPPPDLLSMPFVSASLDDVDALGFHLAAFVANLRLARSAPRAKVPARAYGGGPAYPILSDGDVQALPASEHDAAMAFRAAGAVVTVQPMMAKDAMADMLVWLKEPTGELGPPLLVEVKASAAEPFPKDAVRVVRHLLRQAHLNQGMIVTGAPGDTVSCSLQEGAVVFSASMDTLRRLAAEGGLASGLRKARNRAAHGVG